MDQQPSSRPQDSAFPIPHSPLAGAYEAEPGLTKREWFAGHALAGTLASFANAACVTATVNESLRNRLQPADQIAKDCAELADAMLARLAGPVDAPARPEHVETVAETVAHALLLSIARKQSVPGSSDKFNLYFGDGEAAAIWFNKNAPGGISAFDDDLALLRKAIADARPRV